MAEQLEIVIGANVDDAKAGINSLQQTITQFAQQGKLSIGVVEQSMAQLRAQIKISSDPTEVAKLKEAYQALNQQLQQLKIGGGLESQLNGISRSTRLAHSDLDQMGRSLTEIASGNGNLIESLSRVAFSFEQLRGQTGSAKGAIAELGQVLTSPAGLLIAGAALAPLLADIGGRLLEMANGSRQAEEDLKTLTTQLKASQEAIKGFNDDLDQAAVTRKLKIDIETPAGTDRTIKELGVDLDAAQLKIINTTAAIRSYRDELDKVQASTKKVSDEQKDLHIGSLVFEQNKVTLENNAKQIELLKKQIQDANKELEKAQQDVINIPLKIQLTNLDEARADGKKQLQEFNRNLIERAKADAPFFEVPINLKFVIGDTSERELEKAKAILSGIEEHVIRLKIVVPDKIELPELKFKADDKDIKQQILDIAKGTTIPLTIALDKPSLLETEDQIKQIFSKFSDTNIFSEAGRSAGEKFRKALIDVIDTVNKDFLINPKLDITDLISSLNTSLAGIKNIEFKVIKTETFENALRTLRDLHDAGVEAGNAVEKAFLKAGFSAEDAAKAGKSFAAGFGGITKEAETAAKAISEGLTSAITGVIDAFASGQNPAKAFFDAIINSLEQVIAKIIQAQIEQLILNTLFKAASAAFNPLSLLGLVGLGFAEGGEPPVNQPSIVGEKGWELFVPKVPGTIYSHADSMKLVSNASVKEHESIKEYLIAEKVSQQIKEHFTAAFKSVESSIKVLVTNNERLASYSYHLHDNIQSLVTNNIQRSHESIRNDIERLKESFVSISDKNTFSKLNESITGLKESFNSINKESLSKEVVVNNTDSKSFDKINSSIKEAINVINNATVVNNSASYENLIEKMHTSVATLIERSSTIDKSVTIERIINNNFYTSKTSESLKQMSLHELQHTFHIPAFASGGAVFGPTLAILGEGFGISRSNPEFVGTANQLRGIQGGAFDVNVNVGGELSFSMGKLAIALNREVRSQLRTSGKPPF